MNFSFLRAPQFIGKVRIFDNIVLAMLAVVTLLSSFFFIFMGAMAGDAGPNIWQYVIISAPLWICGLIGLIYYGTRRSDIFAVCVALFLVILLILGGIGSIHNDTIFRIITTSFSWPTALPVLCSALGIFRAISNRDLRGFEKILWVIGEILFFPLLIAYAWFKEKNRVWKIGLISSGLLVIVIGIVFKNLPHR